MPIITLLRGFKVPVEVIDAFLTANGLDETAGTPPFYSTNESEDQVTVLLRKKMPNSSTTTPCRLLLPYKKGYKRSRWAYIAYTWVHVFAQLTMDLEDDLPSDCPPGFHHLKKEIFSFANGGEEPEEGFFVVVNDEGSYIPQELQDRGKVCTLKKEEEKAPTNIYTTARPRMQYLP